MSDSGDWSLFFELFEGLPRQGPGRRDCTERALSFCRDLPDAPSILDLGCGSGAQTLHLGELTHGEIVAVDKHSASIERLSRAITERGWQHRVHAIVGDMERLDFEPESFDLVWSEGALYNLGLARALPLCRALMRPSGYLAFTDAVWRPVEVPEALRRAFEADYPTMGTEAQVVEQLEQSGFQVEAHFTLPDEAWWGDFYTPMEARIGVLRAKYADDAGALTLLDQLAQEPTMHRAHAQHYAYAFFIARRA